MINGMALLDDPALKAALKAFADNVVSKLGMKGEEFKKGEAEMFDYIDKNINEENIYLFVCCIYFHAYLGRNYHVQPNHVDFWNKSIFLHYERTAADVSSFSQLHKMNN